MPKIKLSPEQKSEIRELAATESPTIIAKSFKYKSQIELNFDRSAKLAHVGLDMAVDTANLQYPGWAERCWQLFYHWLQHRPRYYCFLIEDFRSYLYEYDLIERPKSERAFGFIGQKAIKAGLVMKGEIKKVSNVKAHCANAQSWIKL